MLDVWSPKKINQLEIPNRFVFTSVGEGAATLDGAPTTRWFDRYRFLSREGAIGLLITGHTYVHVSGKFKGNQNGMDNDSLIPLYAKYLKTVHKDGSRIFMQLGHAGLLTHSEWSGCPSYGPTKMQTINGGEHTEAMTVEQIQETVQYFAEAARRCREAGFDGVQIHAAHGYLLSEFLSSYFNKRDDEYGGSAARRARMAVEIIKATRKAVGDDYPITLKMNGVDILEGGNSLEESVEQAKLMAAAGLDNIEVSAGFGYSFSPDGQKGPMKMVNPNTFEGALYNSEYSKAIRDVLSIPVTCVGGVRTFEHAQRVLNEGFGDFIGLCRPLIREPDLILLWKHGVYRNSTCLSCNLCCKTGRSPLGSHCGAPV